MLSATNLARPLIRVAVLTALAVCATVAWVALPGNKPANFTTQAQAAIAVFNAASFAKDKTNSNQPDANSIAPNSFVAVFGNFVTQNNGSFNAPTQPLPTTLGGVSVTVNGTPAGLLFVGPMQINLVIPGGVQPGQATMTVTNNDNSMRTGTFPVAAFGPGIFTFNAGGTGLPSAQTTFDGVTYTPVVNGDGTPHDVDAGTAQRLNRLVLYGTGWRNAPAGSLQVALQGVPCTVEFAGPAPGFTGLDQANVVVPPEMSGFGNVTVTMTVVVNGSVVGRPANVDAQDQPQVVIKIGGNFTDIRTTPIAVGQTITGALTLNSQIQIDDAGRTFFFDAYSFTTTTANTNLSVDLRSTDFDALVILYRIDNGTLNFIAADDITGGLGNGNLDNNNALLLTVLTQPASYVLFATSADVNPDATGNYTVKLTNPAFTMLTYGQTVNGAFTANSIQTSAGDFIDVYWFNGTANDAASIAMNAPAPVDAWLELLQNDGTFVDEDDNSGGGTNALISTPLPQTGIFLIFASPFAPNVMGPYTLKLTRGSGSQALSGESLKLRGPRATGQIMQSTLARFGTRRVIR
jgi:uncharacterized protein (TIGR03437 family)